jgi:Tfp pilus assembly protein PilN
MNNKINVLSEEKKSALRRRKRFRLMVWQESAFLALVVLGVAITGSVYAMLDIRLRQEEASIAIARQEGMLREIDAAEQIFVKTNVDVADVLRFQREHLFWSNVLDALREARSSDIELVNLSTTDRRLSLSGFANTRDALLAFQDHLNDSACFANARVPLSDLFAQENVDFQLDVEVRRECLRSKQV